MASRNRDRRPPAFWVALAVGLAGVGCETEVPWGNPINGSILVSTRMASANPSPSAKVSPSGGERAVVQASHATVDRAVVQVSHQTEEHVAPMPAQLPEPPAIAKSMPLPPVPEPVELPAEAPPPHLPLPTEKAKTIHPPYTIEPPDVLLIDAIRIVPRPPYRIEPLDVLLIQVAESLPGSPLGGPYSVNPDGTVTLGFSYGSIRVSGMTVEEAGIAIKNLLTRSLRDPQVTVALAQFRGVQQVRGEHLVGQDGTITLGTYGCVNVTGLTVCQAKAVIERHLGQFLLNPEISLSVTAYNSKVYYVITDGGGFGQQVYRFPVTGNETVLDAISNINGLPAVSSKRRIWLARPSPCEKCCYQILPVNWDVITQAGDTCTNYQLFPGDRIFVKADPFIALDNTLAKIFSPIERVFGLTLLGSATVNSFRSNGNNNNGGTGF